MGKGEAGMATTRTLSVALLLTLCFAACACASASAAAKKPTNRYISYAAPHARGGNDGVPPPGCSAITKCAGSRQPPRFRRPPKAGATTAAAAVSSQSQSQGLAASQTASTKGGYISHAAMSRDKLCGRFGCPNRP